MTQKLAKIVSLGICILVLASLFVWPKPAAAGLAAWSWETTPAEIDNLLGPTGIDIRDIAVGSDGLTVYAAPSNSITEAISSNVVYKSIDGGVNWIAIDTDIQVDLVAIAPDDNNLVVIANKETAAIYFRSSNTPSWQPLGPIKESPDGSPAEVIYDLAISPLRVGVHYIGVAGKEASGIANLWYFNIGTLLPTWCETNDLYNFYSDNATVSLAFSPYFQSDSIVLAITTNATTGAGMKDVRLQALKINNSSNSTWNTDAGFADYPCTIVGDPNLTQVTWASIAITPEYQGGDPDTRRVFIGLTLNGSDADKNGIYRCLDTDVEPIYSDKKIRSIDYDGYRLIAGLVDTNTVYNSVNVLATIPDFQTCDVTKCPSGGNNTVVAYFGGNIVAGTSGDESAFAISNDNAYTFNDIGLIDTNISNTRDVAVNTSGNIIYLVSETGNYTSLWYFDSNSWRRVFNRKDANDFRVHIAPSNDNIVYLTKKSGKDFDYNTNAGLAPWNMRICNITIQDLTVASSQIVYVISAGGVVTKTADAGLTWDLSSSTNLTSGATLISIGINTLFAGSQDGYVSYTFNSGATWAMIDQPIRIGAKSVKIAPDDDFSTNKIIYAASNVTGGYIMKWIIGASTYWTNIADSRIQKGIYGLVTANDVLYALEYSSGNSTLWRLLSPSLAPEASTGWTPSTADGVMFNSEPQALKASSDTLWAINTDASGTYKLYSYTDVIVDLEVNLLYPPDGFYNSINTITQVAYDISFNWERPSDIVTGYQLFISQDPTFESNVYPTISVDSTNDYISALVGPHQTGNYKIDFQPNSKYYWRVRIAKPSVGPFSEIRYFTIQQLGGSAFETIDLFRTNQPVEQYPTFSWSPLADIKEYEFKLSDDWTMKTLLVHTFVESTAYKVEIPLEYGGTYFWQVRATKPHISAWSGIATINIVLEPEETIPPVVVTLPPEIIAVTITAPPQTEYSLVEKIINISPPYWPVALFIVILLMGTVLILIFTGKIPKFLTIPLFVRRRERPPPIARVTDIEQARPTPTLRPTVGIPEKPKGPEKIEPHPSLAEKDKDAAAVIFAAKSFMWMTAPDATQAGLEEKERRSLGKKLAEKIRDVTKKENLYLKYPQDASMLLGIWSEYTSRNETSSYLAKTFELNPYNAIKLLKCYLPPTQPGQEPPAAEAFTIQQYKAVAGVIDPDIVYATLSKIFKFDISTIEEKVPVSPADRNLAFQFMRLHHEAKSQTQ
jgi:hypothetical protein